MPLYALVDGERARAEREGVRRAQCADCATPMIAKTGDVVTWHWAHATEQPGCPAAGESEWHLAWKADAPDGTQEITQGARRADVLAPGGFAVEFQKSPLTAAEVQAREQDWKHKLVWVFDATEACAAGRVELRTHPDRDSGDAYRNVRWAHAPERVKAATCTALLDLDGERLLYVGKWFRMSPLEGYGWVVTRDWVAVHVLAGEAIPVPPGYREHVDEKGLARAARKARARHLHLVPASYTEPQRGDSACPLCEMAHPSCTFAAGSLYCVIQDCGNPHHRPAGPSAMEMIAARQDPFIPYLAPTGTG